MDYFIFKANVIAFYYKEYIYLCVFNLNLLSFLPPLFFALYVKIVFMLFLSSIIYEYISSISSIVIVH